MLNFCFIFRYILDEIYLKRILENICTSDLKKFVLKSQINFKTLQRNTLYGKMKDQPWKDH